MKKLLLSLTGAIALLFSLTGCIFLLPFGPQNRDKSVYKIQDLKLTPQNERILVSFLVPYFDVDIYHNFDNEYPDFEYTINIIRERDNKVYLQATYDGTTGRGGTGFNMIGKETIRNASGYDVEVNRVEWSSIREQKLPNFESYRVSVEVNFTSLGYSNTITGTATPVKYFKGAMLSTENDLPVVVPPGDTSYRALFAEVIRSETVTEPALVVTLKDSDSISYSYSSDYVERISELENIESGEDAADIILGNNYALTIDKYPAIAYADNYHANYKETSVSLFKNGWFLPSKDEFQVYVDYMKEKGEPIKSSYWTCNQSPSRDSDAMIFDHSYHTFAPRGKVERYKVKPFLYVHSN